MNDHECKVRPVIMNINSNELLLYPFSVLVNKCSGRCNDINNQYAKLFVPYVVKNTNSKVLNVMPKPNETCYVSWHKLVSVNVD